jgi:hypothetical protein
MNNSNNRSFTERGRELLDQLKQFNIDVSSNTTNKQAQLDAIITELEKAQAKVSNIHIKFLKRYNFIKGTSDGPSEYPKVMQMDAFLAKLQTNKNKEEKNKKNEENRLAENKRKLNEARTANIANKSKTIRETIERLRRNIGNSNASSNNNYTPPNIFNNVKPNNVKPNNVKPNNVKPNNVKPNNVKPNNNTQQLSPFNNRFNAKIGVNKPPNNVVSHPLKPNMRAFQNQLRSKLANRRAAIANNNNVSPPPNKQNIFANETNNQRANRLKKFNNAKKALSAQLQPRPPL